MKHAKRTRVATGIYQDQCGFLAAVCVRRHRKDRRFPPDTSIIAMQRWRAHAQAELHDRLVDAPTMRALPSEVWQRLQPSPDGWCYVYFVRSGDCVKIGRAVDVRQRFRSLQSAQREPLSLLLSIPAHAELEKAIHARFQHLRERGEWFRLAPDLLAFIEAVHHGANPIALLWESSAS